LPSNSGVQPSALRPPAADEAGAGRGDPLPLLEAAGDEAACALSTERKLPLELIGRNSSAEATRVRTMLTEAMRKVAAARGLSAPP
jgi:hypothetical protein